MYSLNPRLLALQQHALRTPGRGGFPDCAGLDPADYAEAVALYARHCAVRIEPGELIVGGGSALPPEAAAEFARVSARSREIPFPAELQELTRRGFTIPCGNHAVIHYQRALKDGLGRLRERIEDAADRAPESEQTLYRAWRIIARAHADWIRRYAVEAEAEARLAASPERRAELERIAADCAFLAEHAPETFRQACQLLGFVFYFAPDSPGRIDQYLIDYYRRDLAAGRITPDQAREWIACLWIKYFECWGCDHPRGGVTHLALGGVTPEGLDAVNEISWFCCDAAEALRLIRPQIAIRYAPGITSPDFLRRGVELLRGDFGSPDFCNDGAIIPALEAIGIAAADARDYCPSGCHEIMICGRSQMGALMGEFNLPKLLRCALGLDERPGGGYFPRGGIGSFEELRRRWLEALDELAAAIARTSYALDEARAHSSWGLGAALFTDDCVEQGKTPMQGGALYNFCNWDAIGIADLTDSLMTIRTLVFERGAVTLEGLIDAMASDWDAAHESLRQRIRREVAFFGNGDATADGMAAAIVKACAEAFAPHTPYRGGRYTLGTLAGYENAHAVFGGLTGAMPDGRRAGRAFAASLGPVPGRDDAGITAMLRSAAAMPSELLPTSTTVNATFDAALLRSDEGVERVTSLLVAYFNAGGIELQPTVSRPEVLRAALANPEEYANLVVRVAGYSARFTTLEPEVQAEIIARTCN